MKSFRIQPVDRLKGTIEVATDKSISHRSIMFGSLASGVTTVHHLLEGEDVLSTIEILKAIGTTVEKKGNVWKVFRTEPFKAPKGVLYCGNSGTTLRLMTGFLSGLPFTSVLTGDDSLNKRPMKRVMEPLQKMGASIREFHKNGKRFIEVKGGTLKKGSFSIKVASAQLKTALLLAGMTGQVPVSVTEPLKSRDHTERMLKSLGAKLSVKGKTVRIVPGGKLKGQTIHVPGDISSAAFFMVAGLIAKDPKSQLTIRHVGLNPTRTGILDVLKKMGGKIRVINKKMICGEPVGDLVVTPSKLKGVVVPKDWMPRLIDEVPILSVAAALAKGKTVIKGAEELRIKETDRIQAIATEFRKFGVSIQELPDGLIIQGLDSAPQGAHVKSYGDHRIAMSAAIFALVSEGETIIDDVECIQTSFPQFKDLYKKVGGKIY